MAIALAVPIGVLERDRLARFFPALFGLTVLFAAIEATLAAVCCRPPVSPLLRHLIRVRTRARLARPSDPRGQAAARTRGCRGEPHRRWGRRHLPDPGRRVLHGPPADRLGGAHPPARFAAVAAPGGCRGGVFAIAILVLDVLPHPSPAIGGVGRYALRGCDARERPGLVLVGLMDFAIDAHESLRDLRDSTTRQFDAAAERLTILSTLRAFPRAALGGTDRGADRRGAR